MRIIDCSSDVSSSDLYEPKAKHRVHPPIMEIGEADPKIRSVNHPEPAHAGKRHPEARLPGKALPDAMKGRESSVGRVVPADRRHKRRVYERDYADRSEERRVGKEGVRTCRRWGSPYVEKKKTEKRK